MEEPTQPVAHLGVPIAVAAAGGAAVVASMTRWWLLGPFHGAVAMTFAAAIGGIIGTILTQSLRCDPPAVTTRKVVAFIAIAAPLTTMVVALLCEANEASENAVVLGALFAAVLLPAAFVVVRLARAAQRSRVRSLVGRSDRRAAWRTTAVWLSIVSAMGWAPSEIEGGHLGELFWWTRADKALLMVGPLLVAFAACAIVSIVAVLDWRAERIVTRAHDVSADWRIEDAPGTHASALDVGVGHDTWFAHVSGRTTYRENAVERVAAIGDLENGALLLTTATRRSAVALAIATAAQLGSLYVFARLL